MKKVFTMPSNEDWICDRLVREWNSYYTNVSTRVFDADVVWLLSGWTWNQFNIDFLRSKTVVTTVHHIVPEKFNESDFMRRDTITDVYHVPCERTRDQIKGITKKPIHVIPFWVNDSIFFPMDKESCRQTIGFDRNDFLVGSFQRDTEGSDLISPKIEKGPDVFCDFVERMSSTRDDITVVLSGWRRQYVINRLLKMNVKYVYFERPSLRTITNLYSCLDMYLVTSRYEGGPQAIVECAAMRVPIMSSDVGIARQILHEDTIVNYREIDRFVSDTSYVNYANESVSKYYIKNGWMGRFVDMICTL